MTDTGPPTNVTDIIVNGQRRPIGSLSPFPTLPPLVFDNRPEAVREGNGEPRQLPPCSILPAKTAWNRDAAAPAAVAAMLAQAFAVDGFSDFAAREYGTPLIRSSGNVTNGAITWGDPILDENGVPTNPGQQPTVTINYGGVPWNRVIGYIHTHPDVGTFLPSPTDFAVLQYIATQAGVDVSTLRLYTTDSLGQEIRSYQYSDKDAASQGIDTGTVVNPDATPCP